MRVNYSRWVVNLCYVEAPLCRCQRRRQRRRRRRRQRRRRRRRHRRFQLGSFLRKRRQCPILCGRERNSWKPKNTKKKTAHQRRKKITKIFFSASLEFLPAIATTTKFLSVPPFQSWKNLSSLFLVLRRRRKEWNPFKVWYEHFCCTNLF